MIKDFFAAVFFPKMDNYFGIGLRSKLVTFFCKFFSYFDVIKKLTVEDCNYRVVFIRNWLFSIFNSDDTQPPGGLWAFVFSPDGRGRDAQSRDEVRTADR